MDQPFTIKEAHIDGELTKKRGLLLFEEARVELKYALGQQVSFFNHLIRVICRDAEKLSVISL